MQVFKTKYDVDKLVLISVPRIGTIRNYYGFVPLGSPTGLTHLTGQVINLSNNRLEWNQSVVQTAPCTEPWDAPPDYPKLTEAVYTALEQSRTVLLNNFVP